MADHRASEKWTPIALSNEWIVEHQVEPHGVLRFTPGNVRASFRFVFKLVVEEWSNTLACQVRIPDDQGQLWECESVVDSSIFMGQLIHLSRPSSARWIDHAPPEWQEAFDNGAALVEGIEETFDDRIYRYFYLDNTAFCLQFKYQGMTADLAYLQDGRLLVRINQLFGSWSPLPIEGQDGKPLSAERQNTKMTQIMRYLEGDEEDEENDPGDRWGDYDNLEPPLTYELDAPSLLFHNTDCIDQGEHECCQQSPLPLPLRFRKVEEKGEPQRCVTFQPKRQGDGSSFSELGRGDPNAFQTTLVEIATSLLLPVVSGGFLHLGEGKIEVAFRMDSAPGSHRLPRDVIRCRLQLADSSGNLWEARTHFTPEVFFEHLFDLVFYDELSYRETDTKGPTPFADGILLAGARGLLNDGGHRHVYIGDRIISFPGTDQHPRFDVAMKAREYSEGQHKAIVRLSGLRGTWRAAVCEHEDHLLTLKTPVESPGDDQPIPPIIFSMPLESLLFRNTAFAVDEEGFLFDNQIPIPLVFESVKAKGKPQEGVIFRPSGE